MLVHDSDIINTWHTTTEESVVDKSREGPIGTFLATPHAASLETVNSTSAIKGNEQLDLLT